MDIEQLLADLEMAAAERDAVIYNILFRRAGVGIQWYESDRVETKIGQPPSFWRRESLKRWENRKLQQSSEGYVVYNYYPTLGECLAEELNRIQELDLPQLRLVR